MAARKKVKEEELVLDENTTDFWRPNMDEIIEETSQSVGMTPISLQRSGYVDDSISTGLLVYDLCIGGGFHPGRFCGQYGPEQGGKSTACASSVVEAQKKKIDSFFFDHEGSADPSYWQRIGVNLYGDFRSEEAQAEAGTNSGFKAGPNLRYYAPDTAEKSLKFMSRLLHQMPDKRLYNNQWYYVMDLTQAEAERRKIPFDKTVTRKVGGGVWVPAEDGRAQAIFYIDSIAAMKPEALVGKKTASSWKDESGAQALLARCMSENLAGVTSAMVMKRVTIVATNQLREKPGVSYGNPEYPPGGNAVKHAHDNRVKLSKRACPAGWAGKSGIQEETCWNGKGKDRYTFSKLTNEKCKDFMPNTSAWIRWWFDSNGRPGPGIDPVFDTFQYLKKTGQINKSGSKFEVSIPGKTELTLDSAGFKALILDPENKGEIRQACWDQLKSSEGFELFFNTEQSDDA